MTIEKREHNRVQSAFLPIHPIKLTKEWESAKTFFGDTSGKFSRKKSQHEHSFLKFPNGKILILANNQEGKTKDEGGSNVIGKGGFGRVKYAKDEQGKLYAVKIIKDIIPTAVRREANINAQIGYGFAEVIELSDTIYIGLEYLGEPLSNILEKDHNTPDARLDFVIQAFIEIYRINLKGYTHRNVSLQNMVVDDQNTLHIIDYGLMGPNTDNRDVRHLMFLTNTLLLPELTGPLRTYMEAQKNDTNVTSLYLAAALIQYQLKGPSLTMEDLNVLAENPIEQNKLVFNFKHAAPQGNASRNEAACNVNSCTNTNEETHVPVISGLDPIAKWPFSNGRSNTIPYYSPSPSPLTDKTSASLFSDSLQPQKNQEHVIYHMGPN